MITNFRNLRVLRALRGEKVLAHTVQTSGTAAGKFVHAAIHRASGPR